MNSNNQIKRLKNYLNQISISIQHFCIKSNQIIQLIQVIKFFNFKSPNFFKYRIDIENNSAFYYFC
jgi:hypothetical protein